MNIRTALLATVFAVAMPALHGVASAQDTSQTAPLPLTPAIEALINGGSIPGVYPPILSRMMSSGGITATPIGDFSGLRGYLLEHESGLTQTVYVTEDGKSVLVGLLYSEVGREIVNQTAVQLGNLRTELRTGSITQRAATASSRISSTEQNVDQGDAPSSAESVSSDDLSGRTFIQASLKPVFDAFKSDGKSGEDLISALQDVTFFDPMGNQNAPVLYAVFDPNCPYCHRAWSDLEPLLAQGSIDLRIILVDFLNGSRSDSISLLSDADGIVERWYAGEGSADGVDVRNPPPPSDPAYIQAAAQVSQNRSFALSNGFNATPWFFIVDQDNQVYESKGINIDFLAAIVASGQLK